MEINQPSNQQQQSQFSFFFDSHTHLLDYDRQSHLQLNTILKQSQSSHVKYIASNTCCTNQFKSMQQLSLMSTPSLTIIPCYGIHPCYICEQLKPQNQSNDWKSLLKQYLLKDQKSHIGQIGLDFRKDVIQTNPQDKQWQFFQYQFQLAAQTKRSVTIHCVRAYGQLLKYFKKWNTKYVNNKDQKFTIILHSYGGSKQITKSLLKLSNLQIYFSLSLKHSKNILQIIPLQKLILQTDAPYQNDHKILIENQLWKQQELQLEQKKFNQRNLQNNPKLLKECKFFNKSILDNRPKNVIANYRQICKAYKIEQTLFCNKVTKNALRAFKLIK